MREHDPRGADVDRYGGPLIARGLPRTATRAAIWSTMGLAAALAADARGQMSASVSVVSDYRFRGISLSDDGPAVQGSIAWDHPRGWYAGAFASTIDAQFLAARYEGVVYAGFASRLVGDASWDAGVSYAMFPGSREYDYLEAHIGISGDRLSARVHYGPDYFGQGVHAVYVEANGAWPLGDRLNLLAHVGALSAGHPPQYVAQAKSVRIDGRLGLAYDLGWATLQAAWVHGDTTAALYPVSRDGRRNTLVASLSRAF